MPLTAVQRQQARRYTGRTRINAQVDRALENALDAVNAMETADPSAYTQMTADLAAILADLATIDTSITQCVTKRAKFTRVEDVYFAGGNELWLLRSQGRVMVGRLCTLLGCPMGHDPFSGAGSAGAQMKQG